MTHKVIVLGMLITLHSLGALIVSLVTYEWYVDAYRHIGIFGVCENVNSTHMGNLVNILNERLTNLTGNKTHLDLNKINPDNDRVYQKCFQLLWPDSDAAFEYLASKLEFISIMFGKKKRI